MAEPSLKVIVHGSSGRMGREVIRAIGDVETAVVVGTVSRSGDAREGIPHSTELAPLLAAVEPDVIVDFTSRDAALPAARISLEHMVCFVTGTSGLTPDDQVEIDGLARVADVGAFIGPNFSLGAIVLQRLASLASKHFDSVDIVEKHHAGKADAPSGSALATARAMAEARAGLRFVRAEPVVTNLAGTHGGELGGATIHSVRLPGLMAHQEIIFGGSGETLTLRHDTIDRACYMPGVLLAINKVPRTVGLTYGLESFLGFD
jgi:4-hydroxy-tetrahydrodipicolinate reductase